MNQRERAHVLGLERFHAIAVYRTGGVFSTDFYFFDPNCGELHHKELFSFRVSAR
ncbi:hypothetical protein [Corallococcus exercitus]|uniref:Uncharacterized protein n=1 Tax=Corallococcus exercitus TaxID=2316736 RepID=A0A7Y4ND24_9BACT|nr:hypothetical protein [Corallococcus exercitus]NOK09474.1 hypothetical protein [Corallococcus exercitus]